MTTDTSERGLLALVAPSADADALGRAHSLAACWSGPLALIITGGLADPISADALPESVRVVAVDPVVADILQGDAPAETIRETVSRLLETGNISRPVELIHLMADASLLRLLPALAESRGHPPVQLELLDEAGIPESAALWPWVEGIIVADTQRLYPLALGQPALPVRAVAPGAGEAAVRGLAHLPALGGPHRLTVVMPVRGGESRVLRSIEAVTSRTPELFELILVDDASPDQTLDLLAGRVHDDPRLRLLPHDRQRGFAATCNQGLALARGDTVVLLGADTVVTPGWSGRLLSHLENYPRAGAVGARLSQSPNSQTVPRLGYDPLSLEGLTEFSQKLATANDGIAMPVSGLCGICLAIPRRSLRLVGGFDPRFFPGGFEDEDWCLRLLSRRLIPYRAEDVFVHHEGATSLAFEELSLQEIHEEGWRRFKAKWGLPADLTIEAGYRAEQLPAGLRGREQLFIAPWLATQPVIP